MPRESVVVRGDSVIVGWDIPANPAVAPPRFRGLAYGLAVDETTGQPVTPGRNGLRVRADAASLRRGWVAQASGDGAVGIAGMTPLTDPATLILTADRYLPFSDMILPPVGPPPAVALRRGEFGLRRTPVAVKGRVTRAGAPLVNVAVEVTQYSARTPLIPSPVPGGAAVFVNADRMFFVQPPLTQTLPPGNGRARRAATGPVAGATGTLSDYADAGSTRVRVRGAAALGTLVAGRFLEIAADDDERREWLRITAVNPGPTPDYPVTFDLETPLARPHRPGATIAARQRTGNGGWRPLARDAQAGDATLFCDPASTLTDGNLAEIGESSGVEPPMFRVVRAFQDVTDGQGFYRLPPLHRVAFVTIRATEPGPPLPPPGSRALTQTLRLDYDAAENELDFALP